jgi:hypothetical protein
MSHAKNQTGPRPPATPPPVTPLTPWIPAALLGLGINTLAAGVMALGAGAAIGAAVTRTMGGGR